MSAVPVRFTSQSAWALWDEPRTVEAWRSFDACSDRYRRVNAALAAEAELRAGVQILDVGAGAGGTAAACLAFLDAHGHITCVEPAAAMREAGLADPRITWSASLPAQRAVFDRVLCGSSIWLQGPLDTVIPELAAYLRPGGALVFAIPAAYLGEADPPGTGTDPWLTALPQALVAGRKAVPADGSGLPDADRVSELLGHAGLSTRTWTTTTVWTLESQAAWFRLPPVGLSMRPDLGLETLDAAIGKALALCTPGSSRLEHWRGWTAWA